MPDNKYIDAVSNLAQRGALFLFDLGYFKIQAIAQIAGAEAYFLTRHNHQAALFEAIAGRVHPVELAVWLRTESRRLVDKWLYLGARERVAVRLIAARKRSMPAACAGQTSTRRRWPSAMAG